MHIRPGRQALKQMHKTISRQNITRDRFTGVRLRKRDKTNNNKSVIKSERNFTAAVELLT